jgi:hypothetical protein
MRMLPLSRCLSDRLADPPDGVHRGELPWQARTRLTGLSAGR